MKAHELHLLKEQAEEQENFNKLKVALKCLGFTEVNNGMFANDSIALEFEKASHQSKTTCRCFYLGEFEEKWQTRASRNKKMALLRKLGPCCYARERRE